ncbi:MAG: thioredoxin family protein [Flavobacteriaceae bacterium]|jgi:thiol-disulfide isomerase/thioredoxin|nr:thioredoxin family protein [Flavobacteriaceae bacterium]
MKSPLVFCLLFILNIWGQETDYLLGSIQRSDLEKDEYGEWFDENYDSHPLDTSLISDIKNAFDDVQVTVFMGTWCSDSQREVPAFYKVLDAIDEQISVRIIAVDEDKMVPDGSATDSGIEYVPTFIFSKNGKEINRIVEFPIFSLEKDMLDILQGKDYKNAYDL